MISLTYDDLLFWLAVAFIGTVFGNFIVGFLRGLRKRGFSMTNLIRRAVYRSGRRPRPGSVFYSPTLALQTSFLEAVKKQPFPVMIEVANAPAWTEISLNLDKLKHTPLVDATPASLFQSLNFCAMCGTPLVVLVVDVKECPHGHGKTRTFDGPDGLPAILFEPTMKEASDDL